MNYWINGKNEICSFSVLVSKLFLLPETFYWSANLHLSYIIWTVVPKSQLISLIPSVSPGVGVIDLMSCIPPYITKLHNWGVQSLGIFISNRLPWWLSYTELTGRWRVNFGNKKNQGRFIQRMRNQELQSLTGRKLVRVSLLKTKQCHIFVTVLEIQIWGSDWGLPWSCWYPD